eukprot:CAMPEP_0181364018 /NCGR_PEP_ID=MMETSP1106-20121128/9116_1 /TAXON_ID=81844 /ORGANISM="Mantoniella antarctica, Strain SL-175" /LENGTH=178 /DNA_ID=CAMNT_0023478611 /DNA_START=301 /DNA_END=837 /DNA_ORIENTATION=+
MLSRTARRMRSFAARAPVKSSNCSAACPTNMSNPLACVHPTSLASRSNVVSRGLYTASNTTWNPPAARASLGTGLRPTSGSIPTEVVFASTSPRTNPLCSCSSVAAVPPHASANACARSKLRLATITSAPLNLAPNAKPLPAPPAPTTTTVLPLSTVSGSQPSPRDARAASIAAMAAQ